MVVDSIHFQRCIVNLAVTERYIGKKDLENCSSVEVELWNGEIGVKYVKDGDVGWIPVVRRRRKKCARSEESDSSGYVNDKRRSLLRYRKVDGIPGI